MTVQRLIGRLVLVAVVVFGVWYVVGHLPDTTTFGCVSGSALAQAATGDCATTIGQAGEDASWAAARIAAIPRKGSMTSALLYDPDGHETRYTSERNVDSDTALSVGRTAGVFPASGRPNIVDHVEVKAAAGMRKAGVPRGVMVINNPAGPCGSQGTAPYSCSTVVPALLPTGSSLVVWWPGPDPRHPDQRTFTGGSR